MILYHASQYDNAESIMEYGLYPTDGGARLISPSRDTLQGKIMGVYGFVTLDDAINFAGDNGGDGVVFSFEADDDCKETGQQHGHNPCGHARSRLELRT